MPSKTFFASAAFLLAILLIVIGNQPAPGRAAPDMDPIGVQMSPVQDAQVYSGAAGVNYGSDTLLGLGDDGGSYQSLVQFDLSAIPPGAIILTATLDLYQSPVFPDEQLSAAVALVDESWSENTVTWNSRPAATSYGDPSTQFNTNAIGWVRWDVLNTVQRWWTGQDANNGFLFTAMGAGLSQFQSRENSVPPRLIVWYVYPTQTPPPAAAPDPGPPPPPRDLRL